MVAHRNGPEHQGAFLNRPRATSSNWINRLEDVDAIEFSGSRDRASLYRVKASLGVIIGISVQKTRVIGSTFDLAYNELKSAEVKRPDLSGKDGSIGREGFYETTVEVCRRLLETVPDPSHLVGIGIAVPGPVEREVDPKIGSSRTASRWIPAELENEWPLTELNERLSRITDLRRHGSSDELPLTLVNDASAGGPRNSL